MSDFSELKLDGRVATPEDSDWDELRQVQNLAADLRPSAIAFVEGPGDVAAVVRFARERGLKVTGMGTGHGAAALGSIEGAILIRTRSMSAIEIDADARTARAEAGALGSEVAAAAGEHGLCFLPGSSPTVGIAGFTTGGATAGSDAVTASPATGCGRSRWSPLTAKAAPGRCRQRARPLLGAPRRRRRLRDRHRAPPRPAADLRGLRGPSSSQPSSAPTPSAPTATGPPTHPRR